MNRNKKQGVTVLILESVARRKLWLKPWLRLGVLLGCILILGGLERAQAQTVWLEGGLAYREDIAGDYPASYKFGVKGFLYLPKTANALTIYGGVGVQRQLVVDAGVWYAFAPQLTDALGFRTYGGLGLSYVSRNLTDPEPDVTLGESFVDTGRGGAVGFALSVAASYAFNDAVGMSLTYTHRPLIVPEFSQSFDISLGVTLTLDALLGL